MGCVVAGFGAGAIVLTTGSALAFAHGVPVLAWFAWLAVGYGGMLALCAQLLTLPAHSAVAAVTARPALRCWRDPHFWTLVLGIFAGTFAGLLVIGNLTSIGLSWGMSAGVATGAVSLFAVGNAAGRIGWGWLADRWSAQAMIPVMLTIGMITLAAWPFAATAGPIAYLLLVLLIAFFFGGCFVLFATQVSHRYGADQLSLVYPWVFLAYGMAALIGPLIGGWLYDLSQEYRLATAIAALVCGVGAGGFALLTRLQDAPRPLRCVRRGSWARIVVEARNPFR
jgi:OFA family oxalate/formate antiporter-like MFS transporter